MAGQETEKTEYLTTQIITYIGNKRGLLPQIQEQILNIKKLLGKEKLISADLFSGSGIVSRMLKQHSSTLSANDLELYSFILNSCYLQNESEFNPAVYSEYKNFIMDSFEHNKIEGIITQNYAPKDDGNIQKGERAFYTRENALRIDTFRALIDELEDESYRKYFLAPLLTQASVHVNTSGIFKGFYKDRSTGIGCFGGSGKNALSRILGQVQLERPVFSNFDAEVRLYQEDAVELAGRLSGLDVAYLDPPYNQHPYGSNYFMLNLIAKNKIDARMSQVSGILNNWNRSMFNKKRYAFDSMEKIIAALDAKYILVSYNSEGFISFEEMNGMLGKYGTVDVVQIKYNTFRGSRNLNKRSLHVSEYIFILKKT